MKNLLPVLFLGTLLGVTACDYETGVPFEDLIAVCNNGDRDTGVGESDIDCGGLCGNLPEPANLCGPGQNCNDSNDCNFQLNLVCVNSTCVPGTGGPVNNCGLVNCPVGQVCVNPTTGTCQVPTGGGGGPNTSCVSDAGCQAGLSCISGICQAPLCISSNQNQSAWFCSPFAGRPEGPVTPTLTSVMVFTSGVNQTMQMFCCPHNGIYGSIWTSSSFPPGGCTGIGEGFGNALIACHQIRGNSAVSGIQR